MNNYQQSITFLIQSLFSFVPSLLCICAASFFIVRSFLLFLTIHNQMDGKWNFPFQQIFIIIHQFSNQSFSQFLTDISSPPSQHFTQQFNFSSNQSLSQAYTYILDVSKIIYRAGDYSSLDIELKPMKTGKGHQQAVSTAKKENHRRRKNH